MTAIATPPGTIESAPARHALLPSADHSAPPVRDAPESPVLDIVVPVYNEETDLAPAVRRLDRYLASRLPYGYRITIADNASTDATAQIADGLARALPRVTVVHLPAKGRGGALRTVWLASDAAVLCYMDVDLSTDLSALLPLVAPLVSGHSDLAIGTRLHRSSRVVRGAKREFISRCYNLILRGALRARFSDAQCGFKAIRADVARELLPLVQDTGWFFDTELLVLAERSGLRIHEIPVDWVDDPDSSVDIMATAKADLKGVARIAVALSTGSLPLADIRAHLGRSAPREPPGVPKGMTGQALRFAVIGAISTVAYLVLFALLRPTMDAQLANVLAMIVTTVANTAANRRFTFAVRGPERAVLHQFQGLALFVVSLGVTSGSLALLHAWSPGANRFAELAVLLLANLVAAAGRFVLMRVWVFRARRGSHGRLHGRTASGAGHPADSPTTSAHSA
jgi:putative flippase GtrA